MASEPAVQEAIDDFVNPAVSTGNKYLVAAAGVVLGASVSYILTRRYLEKKYSEYAEAEIEEVRELYFEKARKERNGTADPAPKPNLAQLMVDLEYRSAANAEDAERGPEAKLLRADEPVQEDDAVVRRRNTFEWQGGSWNWDAENALRESLDTGVPYVIHRDEFFKNENEWDQAHYTYYERDDILADEHDAPADDQAALVGLENLTKFGHGSFDPNIVYVRNPELEIEIAIVHSDESFQKDQRGEKSPEPSDDAPGDPRKRRSRGGQ